MGLIKKLDVKAHYATRRGLGIAAADEASKRVKVGLSNSKALSSRMTSAEFLQDFCLEHSSHDHTSQAASFPLVAGRFGNSKVPIVTRNLHA